MRNGLKVLLTGLLVLGGTGTLLSEERNVISLGISPGNGDVTALLQQALDAGQKALFFPAGNYLIGTIRVPEGVELQFGKGAVWRVADAGIRDGELIVLKGNRIRLAGLDFDFHDVAGNELRRDRLQKLIVGNNLRDLSFEGLRIHRGSPWCSAATVEGGKGTVDGFDAILLENCRNIHVRNCSAANLFALVRAIRCANVEVSGNCMEGGRYMTSFQYGSESLRHHNNWSRGVTDQAQWWGGDANDAKERVPKQSASVVQRGVLPDDPNYQKMTEGVFDIIIQNNYAENGRTLAWGSRGREVIFDANQARFMSDLAYDAEGCENVIFSNNISINAGTAGIGCYFWSEKIVITGNMILVQNEGEPKYQGSFVRLHSLNPKPGRQTGAGQVVMTGNLFSNAMSDHQRSVLIESGRDVLISGNKFVNGGVRTKRMETGPLSIRGNDFLFRHFFDAPAISLQDRVTSALVSDNVLQMSDAADSTHPALLVSSSSDRLRIIQGNHISGWPVSIRAEVPLDRKGKSLRGGKFLIRDNVLSGALQTDFSSSDALFNSEGNVSEDTLKEVSPESATPGQAEFGGSDSEERRPLEGEEENPDTTTQ